MRNIYIVLTLLLAAVQASAQKFYNLTAKEVRVDSVMPIFTHTESLPANFRDSVYSFSIAYAEYADMPRADIEAYQRIEPNLPAAQPRLETSVVMDRKQPSLLTTFCPVVMREGRWQVLVSFMLRRSATPVRSANIISDNETGNIVNLKTGNVAERISRLNSITRMGEALHADAVAPQDRYARHSVLRSGRWVKIRVPSTGVYQLTTELMRKAGFSNPDRVKVYGYGGNLQSETLDSDYLIATDDLHEVPTCTIGSRRLMFARGPVSWSSNDAMRRTRNPYSDYGYYFLTDDGTEPQKLDSADFVSTFYPSADYYHDLYEVDGFSWHHGGRNLYDSRQVQSGDSLVLTFEAPEKALTGRLMANVTSGGSTSVEVKLNGRRLGTLNTTASEPLYISGFQSSGTYDIVCDESRKHQTVSLHVLSGDPMRLDFVSLTWNTPHQLGNLATDALPVPEYVYAITNQDHHSDPQADMVIIIPTSQKLLAQARRLKQLHEKADGMRVNIVPADELYNEFSSGTPDASAYRRYLKMLYDRATTAADQPKYLVLFGSCMWDNRMLTSECRQMKADDYLLAYESEESFDKRLSYVDDSFYGMLDDGEGLRPLYVDKVDVAVGRFPVTTAADAKTMVDKIESYMKNAGGAAWLNEIMFMGDDGDDNRHMKDADVVAEQVIAENPALRVNKVMWDSYPAVIQTSGVTYPGASKAIMRQQNKGALIMDYTGHGSEHQFSHENVLFLKDFREFSNTNMPLWVTVGCDFMPFDAPVDNIGVTAVLNEKGGVAAFIGSTRTVYSTYNAELHSPLMRFLLSHDDDGRALPIGEALRRAKNTATNKRLAENSRQFSLLGDPAMRLWNPRPLMVIDSIGDVDVAKGGKAAMRAGALVKVKGHIEGMETFAGTATLLVRDRNETVLCYNNQNAADQPMEFNDRKAMLYNGESKVVDGKFEFTFAVPKDISYSDEEGLINVFAIDDAHTKVVNGYCNSFTVGGSDIADNDSIGPSVYCYLNSPTFQNGDRVNPTPYFVAEITDRDGINAAGAGVGHDMQLVIDGKTELTYTLNDNFQYDFGSYTTGSTYYCLPELEEGEHRLKFTAWDILNNPTTQELRFRVARGLKPTFSISCTNNPATTSTTFVIANDRIGSNVDVRIEVLDMSGRLLWRHDESGVSSDSAYTVNWDLKLDNGQQLDTGVYLYRVRLASDGASRMSKAKKLIVVGNK